jgi:NTE family protein
MSHVTVNAVFEGGGVRGIALVGAVKAAEEKGIRFHQYAGTSSGAMVASLLAAGYTADEMKKIIETTPFTLFLKRDLLHKIRLVGPAVRLFVRKGIYSGEALEHWMRTRLKEKGIRTFSDLPQQQLRIIASDITNGKLLVLPDDIAQYGIDPSRFEIAKAVRMSTSIPYFFDPVIIRCRKKNRNKRRSMAYESNYIVDGALLSNFPLWLFDHHSGGRFIPTIGFQLVGRNEGKPHAIRGPITMLQALFSTMLSAHDERYIEQHNRFRTIKIPTLGVTATQFDLNTETSNRLYQSGYDAASKFFREWDPAKYQNEWKKIREMGRKPQ